MGRSEQLIGHFQALTRTALGEIRCTALDFPFPGSTFTGGIIVKAFLPVLAVAALVAVPAATARQSAPPTLESGKLIVAFGDPNPGFVNGTVRGSKFINPRGYEVDLAKAIATKLGVTPVWMYSPWTGLFAPGTKKFDVSFQEATITQQRKRTVDFTTSYLNANQGVLLSKQAPVPHCSPT